MTQWATVDVSDGPDSIWKGAIVPAKDKESARRQAHSFGYAVLRRESDHEDWRIDND